MSKQSTAPETTRRPCPVCGREFSTKVPPGGDGTVLWVRRHNGASGLVCSGSFEDIEL